MYGIQVHLVVCCAVLKMFDDLCLFRETSLFLGEVAFERLRVRNMRSYCLKIKTLETMSNSRLCVEK